jgi:hypothetical protein
MTVHAERITPFSRQRPTPLHHVMPEERLNEILRFHKRANPALPVADFGDFFRNISV